MILTTHLITGAAIASNVQPIPLGLILALLSHYLLDFIPHEDYPVNNIFEKRWKNSKKDFLKVGIDVLFGAIVVLIIAENWLLAILGGFLGIAPDFGILLRLLFPKNKFLKAQSYFHRRIIHYCPRKAESPNPQQFNCSAFTPNKKIPLFWKILPQLAITLLAILFFKN